MEARHAKRLIDESERTLTSLELTDTESERGILQRINDKRDVLDHKSQRAPLTIPSTNTGTVQGSVGNFQVFQEMETKPKTRMETCQFKLQCSEFDKASKSN